LKLKVAKSDFIDGKMKLSPRSNLLLLAIILFTVASCTTAAIQSDDKKTQPRIRLSACRFPKYSRDVLCGNYEVYEDRAAQSGRKISLNIVVLPALSSAPAPDPVFFLYGGPGLGAAVSASRAGDSYWQELRRDRDLVFVDQRGTGKSHSLRCSFIGDRARVQSYFDDIFSVDQIRACRNELEKRADLKLYTTPVAMGDLDEARRAMGYGKINVYGVSYGTQAALEYLRQYGAHVRSVVLTGVATPAAKQPLNFAQAAQAAMNKLIEDCTADEVCHGAFPDLSAEFSTVLAEFDKGPVRFELTHPISKERQPVQMSRGVFVEALRLMLYSWSSSRRVPLLIHQAARGNWVPFGRAALPVMGGAGYAVSGMYMTVTCSETVAVITEEDIARETSNTFMSDYRTRKHQRACEEWPRGDVPPEYYQPVRSEVPVLMVSGEFDPATPLQFGRTAAQSLPNSRQIVIRDLAHGYGSDCIRKVTAEFISQGSVTELDIGCIEGLRPPEFVKELPAQF
jgi:pimeloyl-ACP methyl ester carboxylesterase